MNQAGLGVDRIYEEMLRLGKGMPRYWADEGTARMTLPARTHEAFAHIVADEERAGARLQLDDLILLRALVEKDALDRWSAGRCLQLPEETVTEALVSLRSRRYVTAYGRGR